MKILKKQVVATIVNNTLELNNVFMTHIRKNIGFVLEIGHGDRNGVFRGKAFGFDSLQCKVCAG
jgi:hypothetical protein